MGRPRGSRNKSTIEKMATLQGGIITGALTNAPKAGLARGSAQTGYAPPYVIQPKPEMTNTQLFEELSLSGLTRFGGMVHEEFIAELRAKGKYRVFREMRENSPVISAVLFAIEMALRRVRFYFETENDEEQELRDFLNSCLDDMSMTFQDTLSQIITMLQYGFALHEIVYKKRDGMEPSGDKSESKYSDGRIGWRKWGTISQETLAPGSEWIFDTQGGVQGINQMPPPDYRIRTLPIEKLLLFRTSVAKNNPEGRSLLRGMFIPYYFAKNFQEIEGICFERVGAGIPVMYMGYDTIKTGNNSDAEFAKKVVRDIRTDEQTGVVIPYPKMTSDGKGMLFELVSTPGRSALDFDKVITRYEKRIAMTALTQFIMLGMDQVGSYALSKDHSDLFVLALSAWAEMIAQIITRHALPRLLALNTFTYDQMPEMRHSEVAAPDLTQLANYVNQLVGTNVLVPDSNLENYLREAARLPEKEPDAPTIDELRGQKQQQAQSFLLAQQANLTRQIGQMPTTEKPPTKGEQGGDNEQAQQARVAAEKASAEQFAVRRARGGARYETATNEYQAELESIYSAWLGDSAKKIVQEPDQTKRNTLIAALTALLLTDLQLAGRKGIIEAMQLGAGGVLSSAGMATASKLVADNEMWLTNSLIPAVQARLQAETADAAFMVGGTDAITGLLQSFQGRVASYAGGHWRAIFEGVGDALAEEPDGDQRRVQIVLDDAAEHCPDCPKLAGIYANWDDMLARSGIPGTPGRAQCFSNCRCYLKIETAPDSGVFERM